MSTTAVRSSARSRGRIEGGGQRSRTPGVPKHRHADVLRLQHSAGNHAVDHLLGAPSNGSLPVASGVSPAVQAVLDRGRGQPIEENVRSEMERQFAVRFSAVRVHTDEESALAAEGKNANAMTIGNDIIFGAGLYNARGPEGRRLLAHELAHVVQQSRGGLLHAGSPSLERDAEGAAARVNGGASTTVRLGSAVGVACDPKDEHRDFYWTAFYGNRAWAWGRGVKKITDFPVDPDLAELWSKVNLEDEKNGAHTEEFRAFADRVKKYQVETMRRKGREANGVVDDRTAAALKVNPLTRIGVTTLDPRPRKEAVPGERPAAALQPKPSSGREPSDVSAADADTPATQPRRSVNAARQLLSNARELATKREPPDHARAKYILTQIAKFLASPPTGDLNVRKRFPGESERVAQRIVGVRSAVQALITAYNYYPGKTPDKGLWDKAAGEFVLARSALQTLVGEEVTGDDPSPADPAAEAAARAALARYIEDVEHALIFPYVPPGPTVTGLLGLNAVPISAERREKGKIWVKLPAEVHNDPKIPEARTLFERQPQVFTSGIELVEDAIVGVRRYDQGRKLEYKPAPYLLQMAELSDQAITRGAFAVASLALPGSTLFKVFSGLSTLINDHRGDLIRWGGPTAEAFLDAFDLVDSAVQLYGMAQLVKGGFQILGKLRTAYRNWRAVAQQLEAGLSDSERASAKQISQSTEDLLTRTEAAPKPGGPPAGGGPPEPGAPPKLRALEGGREGTGRPTGRLRDVSQGTGATPETERAVIAEPAKQVVGSDVNPDVAHTPQIGAPDQPVNVSGQGSGGKAGGKVVPLRPKTSVPTRTVEPPRKGLPAAPYTTETVGGRILRRYPSGNLRNARGQFQSRLGDPAPGTSAAKEFAAFLRKNGMDVVGEELRTRVAEMGDRQLDIVVRVGGKLHGIEIKSGTARKDMWQAFADEFTRLFPSSGLGRIKGQRVDSVTTVYLDR